MLLKEGSKTSRLRARGTFMIKGDFLLRHLGEKKQLLEGVGASRRSSGHQEATNFLRRES